MEKRNAKLLGLTIIALATLVGSCVTLSTLAGSFNVSFSGINMVLPVLGGLLGPLYSSCAVVLFFGARFLLNASSATFGIPTFFATLNWATSTKKINLKNQIISAYLQLLLPLACVVAFIVHPVGKNAFVYSFYWVIPMAVFAAQCFKIRSIFLVALSSTFIAHAVGSVMWLYMVGLSADAWLALIPVVAVERFVFAAGSTIVYYGIKKIYSSRFITKTIREIRKYAVNT